MDRWTRIREMRSLVQRRLEDSRGQGEIGSSLAAMVDIHVTGEDFLLLDSIGDDLRLVFVTSAATLLRSEDAEKEEIYVTPSIQPKCERCWHYRRGRGDRR